jgi:hypothetical protein
MKAAHDLIESCAARLIDMIAVRLRADPFITPHPPPFV